MARFALYVQRVCVAKLFFEGERKRAGKLFVVEAGRSQ